MRRVVVVFLSFLVLLTRLLPARSLRTRAWSRGGSCQPGVPVGRACAREHHRTGRQAGRNGCGGGTNGAGSPAVRDRRGRRQTQRKIESAAPPPPPVVCVALVVAGFLCCAGTTLEQNRQPGGPVRYRMGEGSYYDTLLRDFCGLRVWCSVCVLNHFSFPGWTSVAGS